VAFAPAAVRNDTDAMKIISHVVSFHRLDVQKEHFPGDKEKALNNAAPTRRPRPRSKPPVQVSALTPYNALSSIAEVNRTIATQPQVRTPAELVNRVTRAFSAHVRAAGGQMPNWVLLGDVHKQPAGLMMVMAALHEFRNFKGPKTFSIEARPSQVALADQWLQARPRLFTHCMNNGLDIPFPGIQPKHRRLFTACMFAKAHGFQLHGFDPLKRTARDLEHREAGMLQSLASEPLPRGVNVIFTGDGHVPVLHEHMAAVGNTLAISMLPKQVHAGEHEARNRLSYLLTTPAIETIMPSDELRDGQLNAVQFIRRELAPWHPPTTL
jgi:hypothetical protein